MWAAYNVYSTTKDTLNVYMHLSLLSPQPNSLMHVGGLFEIPVITVRLTSLAHSVLMKPNFQGLPWFECDGLGENNY